MCDIVFYFHGRHTVCVRACVRACALLVCVCMYISEFWQRQEFSSSDMSSH
jgi:hypothetical protein